MIFRHIPALAVFTGLLTLGITACQKEQLPTTTTADLPLTSDAAVTDRSNSGTIVDIAISNPNFSTLVAAVVKTNEVGLFGNANLNGTVFAPTNAAFAQLPAPFNNAANINAITNPSTINTLRQVLRYHLIGGQFTATQLTNGNYVTLSAPLPAPNANQITVGRNINNEVFINGTSKVVTANIQASNGVLHVIDRVLLPASQNILQIATTNGNFTALVEALKKTGLNTLAAVPGNLTVFAPTDAAFAQLPAPLNNANNIRNITDAATISQLRNVLRYHVVPSRVFSVDIRDNLSVPTAFVGNNLTTTLTGGAKVKGNGNPVAANIVTVDLLASNGVVHVVNRVLLP